MQIYLVGLIVFMVWGCASVLWYHALAVKHPRCVEGVKNLTCEQFAVSSEQVRANIIRLVEYEQLTPGEMDFWERMVDEINADLADIPCRNEIGIGE